MPEDLYLRRGLLQLCSQRCPEQLLMAWSSFLPSPQQLLSLAVSAWFALSENQAQPLIPAPGTAFVAQACQKNKQGYGTKLPS